MVFESPWRYYQRPDASGATFNLTRVAFAARVRAARLPSGRETLLGVVVGVIACVLLIVALSAFHQDSWLALVAGRTIWHDGVPHHDTLTTLTRGRHWVDQQWLSQLTIYALYRVAGLKLVAAVHVLLVAGSLGAAVAVGRRRGTQVPELLLVLLGGLILLVLLSVVVRTQAYAYPLFVATIALLSADSRSPSRRALWTLPILVLWANVHGSAALGAGLVSLAGLTMLRGRRAMGVTLVIGGPLCLLATPYGSATVGYYHGTLLNPDFSRLVTEWRPVTAIPVASAAFFALAALAVWSLGRHRGRLTLWERLVLLILLAGGITALRNVVWAELVLLMLPVVSFGEKKAVAPVRPSLNQALAALTACALLVALVIDLRRSDREFEHGYPAGSLRAVATATSSDPSLRVFSDAQFADWLLWRLPQLEGRVAFDARFELLPQGGLEHVARALRVSGIDWKRSVRGFRLVVLTPDAEKDAARGFRAEPGRRILYADGDALVILRAAAQAR
jgi:hypothetical protein